MILQNPLDPKNTDYPADYPEPPRPGPDFCRFPHLILQSPLDPKNYASFEELARPHWRGCGKCDSCAKRREMKRRKKARR